MTTGESAGGWVEDLPRVELPAARDGWRGRVARGSVATAAGARRLAGAAYFALSLLVLLPAIDFLADVWPWVPDSLRWRFHAYGLLSGYLMIPLLGILLLLALSTTLGHRRTARALGVVAALTGLALVFAAGVYVLDMLQLRITVPEGGRARFDIDGTRAGVKNVLAAVALRWLGGAAWRATSRSRR